MRIKALRGLIFEYTRVAVSVTLVAFGVSFKVLLENADKGERACLLSTDLTLPRSPCPSPSILARFRFCTEVFTSIPASRSLLLD